MPRFASETGADLRALASYSLGVRTFLRRTITLDEARSYLQVRLASRSHSFLEVLRSSVYGTSGNPYRKLLLAAGIEYEDVERMVDEVGLEGMLERLYEAGVYLTQEEFKGLKPVRRSSLEFLIQPGDLDNVSVARSQMENRSSGSSAASVNVAIDFDNLYERAAVHAVDGAAFGTSDRPLALWLVGDLWRTVAYAKLGRPPVRCFTPDRLTARRAVLAFATVVAGRFSRRGLPIPRHVPLGHALEVARWVSAMAAAGRPPLVDTFATPAARICAAAKDRRLDISGTLFSVGGEPLTPAKARLMADVGASVTTRYAMAETGPLAIGCAAPAVPDEVHLLAQKVAMIQRDQAIGPSTAAPALVYTGLQRTIAKVVINVESGDYANVERRRCGCVWEELGFTTHLSSIRSYQKLTSEGVTFIGSRLIELIEDVLPARFGGDLSDYQIVEEEGEDALTKVSILVAPRVGEIDDAALISTIRETLGANHPTGGPWVELWRQGETLRVIRREPYVTATSKVLPLHILRDER